MTKDFPERSTVASRLRQAREFAGLSQGQVAKLLNMHRPTVSEIEAGRRRVSADEIAQFAKIYDVGVSWLVGEESGEENGTTASMELAARELAKLKKNDIDVVLKLLRTLRGRGGHS